MPKRALYHYCLDNGRCVECWKHINTGRARCDACLTKRAEQNRRYREKQRQALADTWWDGREVGKDRPSRRRDLPDGFFYAYRPPSREFVRNHTHATTPRGLGDKSELAKADRAWQKAKRASERKST